jgi:SAM-dependent methyltransferase
VRVKYTESVAGREFRPYVGPMNAEHQRACASDEWRTTVREQIVPWVLDGVDLGDDVVELGPGYGPTTDSLRGLVARLTAVEIDPELARALATRPNGSNVTVAEGDATRLEFEDGRFSGATCFSMLHHIPSRAQQDRLFAEARRVLVPDVIFVASDSVDRPDLRTFHEGDTFVPIDPEELPRRLSEAGFVDVLVDRNEFAWKARARKGVDI